VSDIGRLTQYANACAFDAIGLAPIADVPPVRRQPVSGEDAGGTPNPLHSRGCEFNQLAPHTPEGLDAPRLHVSRQHRMARGPPLLAGMARHGYSRSCRGQGRAKITDSAHLSYSLRGNHVRQIKNDIHQPTERAYHASDERPAGPDRADAR